MSMSQRYERQLDLVQKLGERLQVPWLLELGGDAWEQQFQRYQNELRYLVRLAEEVRPASLLLRLKDRLDGPQVPWDFSPGTDTPTGIPNPSSPEGAELGAGLAGFYEEARSRHSEAPPLCGDCAFRRGSEPNQKAATLMDAMKCLIEGVPFLCHHGEGRLCEGFALLREERG